MSAKIHLIEQLVELLIFYEIHFKLANKEKH
jgi:hypothetical protein